MTELFGQGDQLYALIRDDKIAQHFLDVAELHQPGLEFTLNGPRRRPDGEGPQGGVFVFGKRLQVGQHRHSSDVLIKGMRANLFQPLQQNVARPDMARLILLTLRLLASHVVVEISPSGKSAVF